MAEPIGLETAEAPSTEPDTGAAVPQEDDQANPTLTCGRYTNIGQACGSHRRID